jgi:hypothetical protein
MWVTGKHKQLPKIVLGIVTRYRSRAQLQTTILDKQKSKIHSFFRQVLLIYGNSLDVDDN